MLELVDLLSARRGRRAAEIARYFGISERTVFRDLADLQERHIPIYHDDRGYRLMDTARLRPMNLTTREHALLKVALHNPALRRQPSLANILDSLERKLDAASAQAEEHPLALQLAPVERSGPKAEKALELLQVAIDRRESVEIDYASLSGGGTGCRGHTGGKRGLDPWQLFQRGGTWYVVGHCHLNDEPRTFRLDRMSAVHGLGRHFEIPPDFDIERHLEAAWSMIRGDATHQVTLLFDPALAPLILNARHHDGETTRQLDDGSIEYRVELSSLEEIARWIVGFGGRCRVVGPEDLVGRVRAVAEGVLHSGEQSSGSSCGDRPVDGQRGM